MSTGIDTLDAVLGGLYWGDNVVWQLDSAPVRPFYRAVADLTGTFESRTFVSLGTDAEAFDGHQVELIDAGPASAFVDPVDLLREIHRLCHPPVVACCC